MPVPTSYTETKLALYLHGHLNQAGLADMLAWSVEAGSYDEIVTDALLAYGVNDIAEATSIGKLRALGLVALWENAKTAVVAEINYSADGQSYSREAIFQHIDNMLAQARATAMPYADDYTIALYGVSHDDPYSPIELAD